MPWFEPSPVAGYCKRCGKVNYRSRKIARKAFKNMFPGAKLSAYRCGEFWHFGHASWVVIHGVQSRADRYNTQGNS